ncbi:MAG: hypothetical protein KDA61_21215 [Planctomycetales bacterium]|nr:hypothetical protein [Planctomycetales bacterium]
MNSALRVGLPFLVAMALWPTCTLSEAGAADEEDAFAFERSDVGKFEVLLDGKPLELQPGPLYTYDEVIAKWHNGTSWVWGAKGRPPVFLNTMLLGSTRYYEFISLSKKGPAVDTPYGVQWRPADGWDPKVIEGAPPTAPNRRARLVQMRNLARRFTIEQTQSSVQRLRLLPQPIYRYASESDESLDGAIFAYLREGDLETILVVDAAKSAPTDSNDGAKWVFDCMPVSIDYQVARIDDEVVWEREKVSYAAAAESDATYFLTTRPGTPEELGETPDE